MLGGCMEWTGHPVEGPLAWGKSRGGPWSPLDAVARGGPAPAEGRAEGMLVPLPRLCCHLLGGWHGGGCEGTPRRPRGLVGLQGWGDSRRLGLPLNPSLPALLTARRRWSPHLNAWQRRGVALLRWKVATNMGAGPMCLGTPRNGRQRSGGTCAGRGRVRCDAAHAMPPAYPRRRPSRHLRGKTLRGSVGGKDVTCGLGGGVHRGLTRNGEYGDSWTRHGVRRGWSARAIAYLVARPGWLGPGRHYEEGEPPTILAYPRHLRGK